MENCSKDTVNLLKECSAGIKTAVNSIDEIMPYVKDDSMRSLLDNSRKSHEQLGNETKQKLADCSGEDKDPNPMSRGMSWLKINMKMAWNPKTSEVADLMTEGCGMGIKSLSRYVNQYPAASEGAKSIVSRTVEIEESLVTDLREYL